MPFIKSIVKSKFDITKIVELSRTSARSLDKVISLTPKPPNEIGNERTNVVNRLINKMSK